PSPPVRSVAAAALGKLGHRAALPALKGAATDDVDEHVRASAHDAAIAVARANGLPPPWPEATAPRISTAKPRRPSRPGFGNQPRALGPEPDLYVMVNSSADDSPGKTDKSARKVHADIIRQTLIDQCKSNPVITTTDSEARRLGLDPRHIDLSVVKMEVATVGEFVEIDAQLRLAISDANGKLLSFLSGGAKVQVPKHKFDARYLPNLRREALENAMRGMFDKLLAHLRDRTTS
ncbi:MAG TPA: HEAT repeat domain-containing protein, partial [Kofleriaceae bacterium]|nr:HEAT repeat domain-containing protein [Kofleriaceae bacterium]